MISQIFSVGHSNQSFAEFVSLLRSHNVNILIDVRSAPYSRFVPHFSRGQLQTLMTSTGIEYLYLGRQLGGKPSSATVIVEGRVDFDKVRRQGWFQQGIDRLVQIGSTQRAVIMCAEEDPTHCHRTKLIGPALKERGVQLFHIRKDGIDRGNTSLSDFF